jgi:DGQHR domain-containing protein
MARTLKVPAIILQQNPRIYSAVIPGKWLIGHSTPSWRIKNPKKGFQRVVREQRAREIALAVLNQARTFPNSIVLATDERDLEYDQSQLALPAGIRFLVVDGQHRLWAQYYADLEANYSCVIHMGLTKVEMARLFLEINDNQKRVPSSLRWDLVRLVRPDDDPTAIEAAELVYELANNPASPLYQRIDLTGEQAEIELKQGSIAPELKSLVSSRRAGFKELDFDKHFEILTRFLAAIRAVDPQGWKGGKSTLMKARVLRALLRLLPDLSIKLHKPPHSISAREYVDFIQRINRETLAPERIIAAQGSAGIKQIHGLLKEQMGL